MQATAQTLLDDLAAQNDNRLSVFDVQIKQWDGETLALSGKLLDGNQLAGLSEEFARQVPGLKLDTTSIQILRQESNERAYVATNLTGLYDRPTLYLPFSSELCYGTEVEILAGQGDWVFTRQPDGYLGWVFRQHLAEGMAPGATHLVLAPSCELRLQPDAHSEIVTRLVSGTAVEVETTDGEWSRVIAHQAGWMPSTFLRGLSKLPASIEDRRKALLQDSARMIGVPYVWGGTSGNGIDCSGLARLVHKWIGIDLPRDADMQHAAAALVEPPFELGDLLFFHEPGKKRKVTHVGISLGGWSMIHSSQGRNGVYVDDVQKSPTLSQNFVSAGTFLR